MEYAQKAIITLSSTDHIIYIYMFSFSFLSIKLVE